jgi:hypothetical protein
MWLKILTLLALFCLWPMVGLAQLSRTRLPRRRYEVAWDTADRREDRC